MISGAPAPFEEGTELVIGRFRPGVPRRDDGAVQACWQWQEASGGSWTTTAARIAWACSAFKCTTLRISSMRTES